MTALVEAARDYLTAGLSIIALSGKAPNAVVHPRGLHSAMSGVPETTEDDSLLQLAFGAAETTGVGIVLPAGYVVVDVDGEGGAVTLRTILRGLERKRTPLARTGRGLHIWYGDPTLGRHSAKLGEKLDLKGIGGYVVAPPSQHPDGGTYEWINPLVVNGMIVPPIELPEPIGAFLDTLTYWSTVQVPHRVAYDYTLVGKMLIPHPIPANMDGLVKKMRASEAGNRNNLLFWAARTAAEEGFELDVVKETLGAAAVEAGLTPQEAARTIRSGYRA